MNDDNDGKHISRGQKLLLLDTTANFIIFITAWSGLFFIIYPHCENNHAWCFSMVAIMALINGGFFAYCVYIFMNEKYREAKFDIIDGLRKVKTKIPCLNTCITVEDKPGFREVSLRVKHEKRKRLRQSISDEVNPLKYRKSFVKEASFINPMMKGGIEMVQNPLRRSDKRGSQMIYDIETMKNPLNRRNKSPPQHAPKDIPNRRRKRGRTMSIIDNLQNVNSQQSIRFKNVINRSKRLKELEAKVKAKKEKVKAERLKGAVFKDEVEIGYGWYEAILIKTKKPIYFHKKTGSVNDQDPFSLKESWTMELDTYTGDFYYHNDVTGETSWDRPNNETNNQSLEFDKHTNQYYYHDKNTGESSWLAPRSSTKRDIDSFDKEKETINMSLKQEKRLPVIVEKSNIKNTKSAKKTDKDNIKSNTVIQKSNEMSDKPSAEVANTNAVSTVWNKISSTMNKVLKTPQKTEVETFNSIDSDLQMLKERGLVRKLSLETRKREQEIEAAKKKAEMDIMKLKKPKRRTVRGNNNNQESSI